MKFLCDNPKTIQKAFDNTTRENCILVKNENLFTKNPNDINMSSIYTTMIQYVGRFAERFASDLLIDINLINETLANIPLTVDKPTRFIFCIGIRRDGVDGNTFLMARLKESAKRNTFGFLSTQHYYRSVLALGIETASDEYMQSKTAGKKYGFINMTLKDITDSFTRIEPEDNETNAKN